ncbi:MAG: hypothetical protein ABIF77_04245 [bacterium]
MTLDLSLDNLALYAGLEIEELAGKSTLITDPEQAIPTILGNLKRLPFDKDEVVLTGAIAIWVYLVVFHYLHGRTKRIYYQDGRGVKVLVAAHG